MDTLVEFDDFRALSCLMIAVESNNWTIQQKICI